MKCDIILTGVGGQGVLTLGRIIAWAAMRSRLKVLQTETHGMAQRGGAVLSHLRLADGEIHSPLIVRNGADVMIALEVLEALRLESCLSPQGRMIVSTARIPSLEGYPEDDRIEEMLAGIRRVDLVDVEAIGKQNRLSRSQNLILLGYGSRFLPMENAVFEEAIRSVFAGKGEKIVQKSLEAFQKGAQCNRDSGWVRSYESGPEEADR